MALIRQADARTMARDAVVLDLGDLAAQGELLKARARAEADQIVAEAQAERERLISGAADEGRREGLAKGLEEGRAQGQAAGRAEALKVEQAALAKLQAAWTGALGSFDSERDRLLLEARQDIVRLAALVAEMVTKRVVQLEPERVADQLGAVLALVAKPSRLTVAVHPEDESLAREALPALGKRFESANHAELVADSTLERGSCVLRTPGGGEIDASIRTQLQRITETLLPGAGEVASGEAGAGAPSEPAP